MMGAELLPAQRERYLCSWAVLCPHLLVPAGRRDTQCANKSTNQWQEPLGTQPQELWGHLLNLTPVNAAPGQASAKSS